jgi:DNA-binding protein YbaB
MFEQLKDLKKAQAMQRAFAEEKHTVEKQGISVTVNGNFRIEKITINSSLEQDVAIVLKDLVNQAFQEIQQKLARHILR